MSVSSGTGLPGLSLTKAVKRLCVCACVCVCVCVSCRLACLAKSYVNYNMAMSHDSSEKEAVSKLSTAARYRYQYWFQFTCRYGIGPKCCKRFKTFYFLLSVLDVLHRLQWFGLHFGRYCSPDAAVVCAQVLAVTLITAIFAYPNPYTR